MSAKFTKGPYQSDGRFVFKLVDNQGPKRGRPEQVNLWMAAVQPCGEAVETAELEAVATLFQAAPLLYEALKEQCQNALELGYCDETCCENCKCNTALRAARGEG